MSDTNGTIAAPAGERRYAGVTRILLGFVIGALFALLPMYYFYMGREAALRSTNPRTDNVLSAAPSSSIDTALATDGSKAFASRLSYELSHAPEERAAPPKPAAPLVRAHVASAPAPAPPPEALATERVTNARPISAVPPAPRDRTDEIEREGETRPYQETRREPAKAPPAPASARVIEGRDVALNAPKLPDTPTRPIVASATGNMRAEIEAERRVVTVDRAPAPALAAANTPPEARTVITPASASTEPIASAAAGANAAKPGVASAGGAVDERFEATREWLAQAAPTTHTIQLMGASSEEQLKREMKVLAKVLEPDKLYLFRTRAQGKPSITLLYGSYADRKSALEALGRLPTSLAANRPVLRTVSGIRAEMKQHGTEG